MRIILKSAIFTAGLATTLAIPTVVFADEGTAPHAPAPNNSTSAEDDSIYVPKAIREGTATEANDGFEDGTQNFMRSQKLVLPAAGYPNVNNYIKSKNFSTAKIEYQLKSQFPKFNYRNGYGKPEGIVLHETANNNSTIQNEIDYMSTNWENAFVHAFVDKSRIIQIHPSDNAVWGAGQYANARFVQFELVRSKTFDDFARSINNYAYYAAFLLDKYNLPVKSAEANGSGTVWSHNAVTRFLGGTTHTDPIGYFSQWGYNMNSMVALIQEKYNELHGNAIIYDKQIWAYGRVGTAGGNRVWSKPYGTAGSTLVGPLANYTGKELRLLRETKVANTVWYQFSAAGKTIGWVDASAIKVFYNQAMEKNVNLTKYAKNASGKYYLLPVADAPIQQGTLANYGKKPLKIDRQATIEGKLWYRINDGAKRLGWIQASDLQDKSYDPIIYDKQVWGYGRVGAAGDNRVWSKPYGTEGSTLVGPLTNYAGKDLRLLREAKVANTVWYQFSAAGKTIGWVDASAIKIFYNPTMEKNVNFIKYGKNSSGKFFLFPVADPTTQQTTLANYMNKPLKIDRQATIEGKLWYRTNDGAKRIGWILASEMQDKSYEPIIYDKQVWGYGRVSTAGGNRVWSKPYGTEGSTLVGPLTNYAGKDLRLLREAKVANTVWYQFSANGKTVGWVDAKTIKIFYSPTMEKNVNFTKYGKISSGKFFLFPVADPTTQQTTLANYMNKPLKIDRQATIEGKLWYRTNDGAKRIGWILASEMQDKSFAPIIYDKQIWAYGRVGTAGGNRVWSKPYGTEGSTLVNPLANYVGKDLRLLREAKVANTIWYQFSAAGKTIGWVDASAINVFYNQSMEHNVNLTKTVQKPTDGYYLLPVADPPIKLGTLAAYNGKAVKVDRQATIENTLWYRITDQANTRIGWIKASSVR